MFDGASASDPMPLATAILLGIVFVAAGALLAAVASKSRTGNLPRNWIVGIRTTTTLNSEEAWDAAHRAGARPLMIGAVGSIVAGIPLLFRPSNAWGLAFSGAGISWLLLWVIVGGRNGTKAARDLSS